MKLFVQSIPAAVPAQVYIKVVSIALAAIFTVLAVAQLYSFEDFPDVVASFWLPGGILTDQLVASLLVTLEVLAIPFLLFMRLSPAMRILSMVAGWVVAAGWLAIALWINLTVNAVTNSGVLGATIPVAPGWWMVLFFVALGALVGMMSWQMTLGSRVTLSAQEDRQ